MVTYILFSILYILFFLSLYIGFKKFNSLQESYFKFKENYYKDKNFNYHKVQNLEEFYNKVLSENENFSKLVESFKKDVSEIIKEYQKVKNTYENYIKDNQKQVESIKKVYEDDKVMENFYNMKLIVEEFEKKQDHLQKYLIENIYEFEQTPSKLRREFKKQNDTHKSQISKINTKLSELESYTLNYQKFTTQEISSLKEVIKGTKEGNIYK